MYTESRIKNALDRLNSVLPDHDVNNGVLFQPYCNTTITKDFTRKSLKRINAVKCHFLKSIFNGVAAAGSRFTNTTFQGCDFYGANFQYCFFENVRFNSRSKIKGSNFSHSVFVGCVFSDISIVESTLYDCYFEECSFSNSTIRTNTLENSSMCGCNLSDVDLAHLNLEYMKFEDVHLKNVILPPYQVPYLIGVPAYLKETEDEVFIYSDAGNKTANEYCCLYEDLEVYYYYHKEFFPLANILIARNQYQTAFDYIKAGIGEACDFFDFRMIKHYCRLACSCKQFAPSQLKQLYDLVTGFSYSASWNESILHSYMLNIGEIREILLNNSEDKQRVEFVVKTNIDKEDLKSINELYNHINRIIKETCSSSHVDSIELRHNSPYEIYVTCIDNLPNIMLFISTMYGIFMLGGKGLDFVKKIEDTVGAHLQNKIHKIELQEKELDIELKKSELKEKNRSKSITTCSVVELEHFIKCNSINAAKEIVPEYLHFKVTNTPE